MVVLHLIKIQSPFSTSMRLVCSCPSLPDVFDYEACFGVCQVKGCDIRQAFQNVCVVSCEKHNPGSCGCCFLISEVTTEHK